MSLRSVVGKGQTEVYSFTNNKLEEKNSLRRKIVYKVTIVMKIMLSVIVKFTITMRMCELM